jgi:hypothetical protein
VVLGKRGWSGRRTRGRRSDGRRGEQGRGHLLASGARREGCTGGRQQEDVEAGGEKSADERCVVGMIGGAAGHGPVPDFLWGHGSRPDLTRDRTTDIVSWVDPTAHGLTGDVDPLAARDISQLSYVRD